MLGIKLAQSEMLMKKETQSTLHLEDKMQRTGGSGNSILEQ
jgi:hypothetical protein